VSHQLSTENLEKQIPGGNLTLKFSIDYRTPVNEVLTLSFRDLIQYSIEDNFESYSWVYIPISSFHLKKIVQHIIVIDINSKHLNHVKEKEAIFN
jgi:hypothetical protein